MESDFRDNTGVQRCFLAGHLSEHDRRCFAVYSCARVLINFVDMAKQTYRSQEKHFDGKTRGGEVSACVENSRKFPTPFRQKTEACKRIIGTISRERESMRRREIRIMRKVSSVVLPFPLCPARLVLRRQKTDFSTSYLNGQDEVTSTWQPRRGNLPVSLSLSLSVKFGKCEAERRGYA